MSDLLTQLRNSPDPMMHALAQHLETNQPRYLTTAQAAARLQVSQATLRRLLSTSRDANLEDPPHIRVGKQWRWDAQRLTDWLERLEQWRTYNDATESRTLPGETQTGGSAAKPAPRRKRRSSSRPQSNTNSRSGETSFRAQARALTSSKR